MEDKKKPSISLKLKIMGNDYEVKFPTNGQLIDIETYKTILGKGANNSLYSNGDISSTMAFITIDMVATFTHLIPDLKKDLQGVKSILDLNPLQSKELRRIYLREYLPWYNDWMDYINQDTKEEEEEVEYEEDEGSGFSVDGKHEDKLPDLG